MSDKLHAVFVTNVRELLEERGWSQAELAAKIGVVPNYISQLLNGHRHPGLDSLERISKAFKIEAGDLLKKIPRQLVKSP